MNASRPWDILRTNDAASRFFGYLLGDRATSAPANVLRMTFDPGAVRPFVANWEAVAESPLGTPQDVTVKEIRIECFFPTDHATESAGRRLAS